jgi:hypothetical protein
MDIFGLQIVIDDGILFYNPKWKRANIDDGILLYKYY